MHKMNQMSWSKIKNKMKMDKKYMVWIGMREIGVNHLLAKMLEGVVDVFKIRAMKNKIMKVESKKILPIKTLKSKMKNHVRIKMRNKIILIGVVIIPLKWDPIIIKI